MKNIKYLIIFLFLLIPLNSFAGMFGPSNYWECILDEMPGAKNDTVATAIIIKCRKKFPNTDDYEKKSPLFGPKSANECVMRFK